jgi:CII-binding regulator of phage lambda lysogenization HflD
VNVDELARRLEALERVVSTIDDRLKEVETSISQRQEIETTVLSAIASAHSAIRNAIRLTQAPQAGRGVER